MRSKDIRIENLNQWVLSDDLRDLWDGRMSKETFITKWSKKYPGLPAAVAEAEAEREVSCSNGGDHEWWPIGE